MSNFSIGCQIPDMWKTIANPTVVMRPIRSALKESNLITLESEVRRLACAASSAPIGWERSTRPKPFRMRTIRALSVRGGRKLRSANVERKLYKATLFVKLVIWSERNDALSDLPCQ